MSTAEKLSCWEPKHFPEQLRRIKNPPEQLYVRGNDELLRTDRPMVAIVGARKCTSYGAQVAGTIAQSLALAGINVVSGLAFGIDTSAHRGTLTAREGKTIAVLGHGIDQIYPRANTGLADDILALGGLLVSEYGKGVQPAPWRFPARNRIIAGLAASLVVVESTESGGGMIAVRFALEEGRDVWAVPGPITSSVSLGPNKLLYEHNDEVRPLVSIPDFVQMISNPYWHPGLTGGIKVD